jgi:hypothetical protein
MIVVVSIPDDVDLVSVFVSVGPVVVVNLVSVVVDDVMKPPP